MAKTDYSVQLTFEAVDKTTQTIDSLTKRIEWLEKQVEKLSQKAQKEAENSFSKIESSLKKIWITAAIYKVWQAIWDLTTAFEPVESSFYRLSESVGIAGDEMLQAMREATLWTVSDYNLMQEANTAYSLWIVSNIEDMTTMMEIARLKWQAMWRSMEEALDDIVRWLGRWSTMILDNLWIVIKQSEAEEQYAESIWKTVEQLTAAEKKQALVNAVVEQGKKELEEAGEVSLTTQERFAQLQTQFQNIAVEIWQRVMPWVNYFLEQLNTWVKENENVIVKAVSGVIKVIAGWLAAAYNIIASLWELLWGFFSWLWVQIANWFNKFLNKWINRINEVTSAINDVFWTNIKQLSEKTVLSGEVMEQVWIDNLWWAVDDVTNRRNNFIDDYMKANAEAQNVTKKTASTVKDLWNAMSLGWTSGWGSKSSNKASERIKEIKDQYELLTYNMDEQYKKIKEVNEEWKKWFDEIEDKFNEADKNVKSLTDDVNDLKKSLSDLNKSETSDIATEFVNARKELQKMERDYAWIWEVASKYSLDFLENYEHGWIGKYDIDALIQYKKYSDEMASVYDWMNASERKAMDEQIAYQEWYQSLNGIEKIKEDYRIKREEIQSELNEKMSALRTEQLKREEIDKQMKEYQKEWLKAIDEEIKKYAYAVWEKKRYEKEYMDQLEIDYKRQQQMYDDLIRKARELAQVRADTWWPSWKRASWWPVYNWQSYLVWEHWPELFIPSQNWSIVKNEDLWRWQEFTINVNMWWVVVNDWQDTQQMAEEIANTITRQLELYKKGIY